MPLTPTLHALPTPRRPTSWHRAVVSCCWAPVMPNCPLARACGCAGAWSRWTWRPGRNRRPALPATIRAVARDRTCKVST
ncbi:hypothetical protein D3C76_989070 [compost metagenome]